MGLHLSFGGTGFVQHIAFQGTLVIIPAAGAQLCKCPTMANVTSKEVKIRNCLCRVKASLQRTPIDYPSTASTLSLACVVGADMQLDNPPVPAL